MVADTLSHRILIVLIANHHHTGPCNRIPVDTSLVWSSAKPGFQSPGLCPGLWPQGSKNRTRLDFQTLNVIVICQLCSPRMPVSLARLPFKTALYRCASSLFFFCCSIKLVSTVTTSITSLRSSMKVLKQRTDSSRDLSLSRTMSERVCSSSWVQLTLRS